MELHLGCELGQRSRSCLRSAVVAILALSTCGTAQAINTWNDSGWTQGGSKAPGWSRTWVPGGLQDSYDTGSYYDQYFAENEGKGLDPGTKDDTSMPKGECTGNPIVRSNGNKIEVEVDFETADAEMPLRLERIYRSNGELGGSVLRSAWRTNFDYGMLFTGTDVHMYQADGRDIRFVQDGGGRWKEDKASPVAYVTLAGGVYTHHREDGGTERYENVFSYGGPLITQLRNREGVGWNFAYQFYRYSQSKPDGFALLREVTHTSGKKITFERVAGAKTVVTDPAGRKYIYVSEQSRAPLFLPEGNLMQVQFPDGSTVDYHHDYFVDFPEPGVTDSRLAGKSYSGRRYSVFKWRKIGERLMPVSTEHAGEVERVQLDYTLGWQGDVQQVVETNALGKQATYVYQSGKLQTATGHPSPNCSGTTTRSKTYDAAGYEDVVTDFAGGKVNYDYDPHGHLVKRVDGEGGNARTTTFGWDEASSRLVRETLVGQSERTLTYTGDGRVETVQVKDVSGVTARNLVTTYAYTKHANGLLSTVTVDGPLQGSGDVVVSTYSASGALESVRNGLGHVTSYSAHDAMGRPGRVVDPNGVVTDYEYDARGHVTLVRTYPSGSAVDTRYVYESSGLLGEVQYADGNRKLYHYDDARRLVQEDLTSPGGGFEVKRYVYNANSQPLRIEVGRDN